VSLRFTANLWYQCFGSSTCCLSKLKMEINYRLA
jgi:hypothetical protein